MEWIEKYCRSGSRELCKESEMQIRGNTEQLLAVFIVSITDSIS